MATAPTTQTPTTRTPEKTATTATPTSTAVPAYRKGFETLEREVTLDALECSGALPAWLAGSLVRTGPAKFEAGEQSLRHWFDGLAMLHRFSFADGAVSYGCRFLRTPAYAAAEEGRIGFQEFATDPCRSLFRRFQTAFAPSDSVFGHNANVNVARLGDRHVAMTETPMPVAFDPQTLETLGVTAPAPGHHSTAHPHHDPGRDEAINHVVRFSARSQYRFFVQRADAAPRVLARRGVNRPAYVHSFGLSERHLVLAECPLTVNPTGMLLSGRPFIENYRWDARRGARLLVFERDSGRLRGAYETEAFFTFHHVNAFERRGELVVDLCAYDDSSIVDALYVDRLRAGEPLPEPQLRRYRLDLGGGAVRSESLGAALELPRIAYRRCNGRPYRYVYGVGPGDGFLDRVVKMDVERGGATSWRSDGCYPGEPVFVAAPGADAEDDGVLLSVVLDAARGTSFLLVLDAGSLEERARAEVPHHIPFGFHGQFVR
jgi:carotenoid cleavage dioxygenase-like enzyme